MIVTAWNNGHHLKTGAGYGLKISTKDRSKYFRKNWKSIFLKLPGQTSWVVVNVGKKSFWDRTCGELIKIEIGKWLLEEHFAPWTRNSPPKFRIHKFNGRKFIVVLKL